MMADAIQAATPPGLDQPPKWADQEVIDALYAL
jgi:hypothetical protein